MKTALQIKPFKRCPARDGFHCVTNALSKLYYHYGHPLSEEMLLGLAAGMGFVYWHSNQNDPAGFGGDVFVGGRGNPKDFIQDIAERTCVILEEKTTTSIAKAERALLEKLSCKKPVMVYGDMAYLPWFDFPVEFHFGAHAFLICGWDGDETVLVSDMDQGSCGLKKGFYATVTLSELRIARSSPYKPFPPKNYYIEPDFSDYHAPIADDINESIQQCARAMLHPPIKNLGIKGIRHTAEQILLWPEIFSSENLLNQLFNLYIFTEQGGTGGGSFRYMYSRFLRQAGNIINKEILHSSGDNIKASGQLFTEMALQFKNIHNETENLGEKIVHASNLFYRIADLEEETFKLLEQVVS